MSNFEGTRWFLVLRCARPAGENGLSMLLCVCNDVVQRYGQPPLYVAAASAGGETARKQQSKRGRSSRIAPAPAPSAVSEKVAQDVTDAFHVSIGWSLTAPSAEMEARTTALARSTDFKDIMAMCVDVSEVKAKVGNVVVGMPLSKAVVERGMRLGF